MKFIHIGDLHLGKRLIDVSLIEDQRYILDQIVRIAIKEQVSVLVVAGDVYDRIMPSEQAFELWDHFLTQCVKASLHVLVISGNHDSNARLGVGAAIMENKNVHIITQLSQTTQVLEIEGVEFTLIPFLKPSFVRNAFPDFNKDCFQEAFQYVVNQVVRDLSKPQVMVAHQFFVANTITPERSDSEVDVSVGGLDAIDTIVCEGYDYVALGHIHRPQQIGKETIRYSGSILKYSLSEMNHQKSLNVVEIKDDHSVTSTLHPLIPMRDMIHRRGTFEHLMASPYIDDYVYIELEDTEPIHDVVARLRTVYPHFIRLRMGDEIGESKGDTELKLNEMMKPIDAIHAFYELQTGETLNSRQTEAIRNIIESMEVQS